ncbi:MAG: helix-turn-helix transcriptional regulator [Cyanobacteria bacterium J06635_1]
MVLLDMKVRRVQEWDVPDLPEKLKAAAQKGSKSVAQICREAEISTAFWYEMVKGNKASISHETLLAVCKALGIEVGEVGVND